MRKPLAYVLPDVLGLTTWKGMNIPWLHYTTRGEAVHDGYGNGFADYYFNDTGANADLQAQLDLLAAHGFGYLRVWLNIHEYMNADRDTVGYTAFQNNLLVNFQAYCSWCAARNLKLIVSFDDGWYTFPWTWLSDTPKTASYIQAVRDVVTACKDSPAIWAWEYANEPYGGWSVSDLESTIKTFQNTATDIGVTRQQLTDFYLTLYGEIKAIDPVHYCCIGGVSTFELQHWNVAGCSDFYQYHWYNNDPDAFTATYADFDKPVIVGEFGSGSPTQMGDLVIPRIAERPLQAGFPLVLFWALDQCISKATGSYTFTPAVRALDTFSVSG